MRLISPAQEDIIPIILLILDVEKEERLMTQVIVNKINGSLYLQAKYLSLREIFRQK